MPSPLQLRASLTGILDAHGLSHVIHVHGAGQRGHHLVVREALADTAPRADAKGAEGALRKGHVVGRGDGAVEAAGRALDPPLGDVGKGRRVVRRVVVDGVVRDADDGALGDAVPVDGDAAREDLAREDAADRGREAHGFVDAGAEVGAGAEGGALDDLFGVGELGADFLGGFAEGVFVADEVEQSGGHGGRRGIRSSNDATNKTKSHQLTSSMTRERYQTCRVFLDLQQVRLGPELRRAETLASLWVTRLEEVVEEVATVRVLTELGALGELALGVGHVPGTAGGEVGEEELVELEGVDDGHGSALDFCTDLLVSRSSIMKVRGGVCSYDEMPSSSSLDKTKSKPIIRTLQHMKRLAKAQIAQNVHGQITAPITHILRHRPPLRLLPSAGTNLLAKRPHVTEDVPLDALHSTIAKRLAHDAPLAGVQLLVARVVRVGDRVGKGVVELGLAHVGLEAVDVLEGGARVKGQGVGAEAHDGAVTLVQAPELEVPVPPVGVVELVGVCEFGEEGTRVLGQRVEEEAVDGQAERVEDAGAEHNAQHAEDVERHDVCQVFFFWKSHVDPKTSESHRRYYM